LGRQLCEGLLPGRSLLLALRTHGPDPAGTASGAARPEPGLMSVTMRVLAGRPVWSRVLLIVILLAAAVLVPQLGSTFYVSVAGNPTIGPIDRSDRTTYYYFVLAVFVACAVLMWALVRSPFGLSLRGIQNNEQRMRTLGYNVWLHKYLVFVIAGLFGGVSGIL